MYNRQTNTGRNREGCGPVIQKTVLIKSWYTVGSVDAVCSSAHTEVLKVGLATLHQTSGYQLLTFLFLKLLYVGFGTHSEQAHLVKISLSNLTNGPIPACFLSPPQNSSHQRPFHLSNSINVLFTSQIQNPRITFSCGHCLLDGV